jgi:hypothetical protein
MVRNMRGRRIVAKQSELFEKPPRAKPRKLAKLSDWGGENGHWFQFTCQKCGWVKSGYCDDLTISEARRGWPCEPCNSKDGV